MKKLLSVALALVTVLSMTVPVAAAVVNTEATVGGGTHAPFICAKFETPDEEVDEVGDVEVEIIPEAPAPPHVTKTAANDGWKRVNFYVVAGDPIGSEDLAAVDVTVRYPNGTEKFQLHAIKPTGSGWTADQNTGPDANPAPYDQAPPAWTVRRLVNNAGVWDKVDMNADGDTNDAGDLAVPAAFAAYGEKVAYGPGQTQSQVVADISAGKQIMLELSSYMWFKQPALDYTVEAKATDRSGSSTNPALSNVFEYEELVSLYLDFDAVNFGPIAIDIRNIKYGDNDLTTSDRPTIWDNGNVDAQVLVSGTKMYLWENGVQHTDKFIDDFDAHLDFKAEDGITIIHQGTVLFTSADAPKVITQGFNIPANDPVRLQACHPGQIDFSVRPPIGTIAGTYKGTFTITVEEYPDPS